MTIAIISHPATLQHDIPDHPEQPARVQIIQEALKTFKFKKSVQFYEPQPVDKVKLKRVHDSDYVDWIFQVAPQAGFIAIDADTLMNEHSLLAALLASGAVLLAVDLVMQGQAAVAFCNVRPPGHHAERDKAMGFCFFNNVAVGTQYAIDQYQLERIAIIDFDVHHGNGTQHIFQNNKKVMLCSSFQHPFYPGYEPKLDNEHILNVPLNANTNGTQFREKVTAAWFDPLNQFAPQLIFFSAGFDAHQSDPLANLQLTASDYVWITEAISDIAGKHAGGKMISVLEGGYNLEVLKECVPLHVDALIGR